MTKATDGARGERVLRWLVPTLGGLLVLVAYPFAAVLRGTSLFSSDGDPGRHIRLGTYILETMSIPTVDLFSHTMSGEPFIPFEWLSEVIFAAAHMLAGLAGVVLLTAGLFAVTAGLVYVTIRRMGVPSIFAFLFAMVSLVLQAAHLHPRPHLFTTLLVAVFAYLLLEARRDRRTRRLLWLPILMTAWANLHGGFLVGFILAFLFAADAWWARWHGEEERDASYAPRVTGIVGLCMVASLLTPAGLELWPHTVGYLGEDWLVAFTSEYNSPDFHNPILRVLLAVLLLTPAVLAHLRTDIDLLGLGVWILFAAFALHSARNIPLFAVVGFPWIAWWSWQLIEQMSSTNERVARFSAWTRRLSGVDATLAGWPTAILGVVLLSFLVLSPGNRDRYRFSEEAFPVAAVESLLDSGFESPGPVYNEFTWGGYLLYRTDRAFPVFIDGQTDFYGQELTQEYLRIHEMRPDWLSLLIAHDIHWALVPPDAPVTEGLRLLADWDVVYEDGTAVVFVRSGT